MLPIDSSTGISQIKDSYLDPNSLNSVKAMGRDKDPQALKEVAKKFEAMFVQQMLKTMREANEAFSEGNYFDSQTTRFHRDMLDQQMVLNLTSGSGIGLADHFYQQMLKNYGGNMKAPENSSSAHELGDLSDIVAHQSLPQGDSTNGSVKETIGDLGESADVLGDWTNDFMRMSDNSNVQSVLTGETDKDADNPVIVAPFINYAAMPTHLNKAKSAEIRAGQKGSISDTQENFVMLLKPHAEKAAAELNINPDVLIAQVALETGWGKHVIHDNQGNNSFNLFNIKANTHWQGDKVNVSTLEYRNGIAANEKADFRKYTDYAESFSDYVSLMKNNPRYDDVLAAGTDSKKYAEALQAAGYATDPEYAKKIKRLLNSDAIKSVGELTSTVISTFTMAAKAGRTFVE
ncbi:flagellar assembly peptidoglycan hydrolase FlgJ [Cellvibrio sp. pealriver]|uniref:flagellar assembly peptidoglycan hydrolase FlgJ n=1 Tax=Cellvibrio sp. pealriver TaxID=1622269 RepID=UPI00066FB57C|nr:flagellar assembly peptidoglycan hydrolase FlgJ [Cellvibrio sp. pealriver]